MDIYDVGDPTQARLAQASHDISLARKQKSEISFSFGTPLERVIGKVLEQTGGSSSAEIYAEVNRDARFAKLSPIQVRAVLAGGSNKLWHRRKDKYTLGTGRRSR